MSDITRQQLQELTAAINDSFNEFERDGVPVFRTLMPGQVRLILAEIEGWQAYHNPTHDAVTDAYWRGHADGAMVARGQVAHANGALPAAISDVIADALQVEIERPDPEPDSIDATTGIADDDWCGDDGEEIEDAPDFDGGFYMQTPAGHTIHVNGDPNMSEEDAALLGAAMDAVAKAHVPTDDRILTPQERLQEARSRIKPPTEEVKAEREAKARAFFGDEVIDQAKADASTLGAPPLSAEFVQLSDDNKRAIDDLALKQAAAADDRPGPYGEPLGTDDRWDEEDERAKQSHKMIPGQRVEFKLGDPVELSPETVTSMQGSAHTLIAPLVPRRPGRPRTVAEADELEAERSNIIVALQAMAIDGAMPAILTYDSDRPEHLPRWQVIQDRHGVVSWRAMARMADLEYGQYRERITERKLEERIKPGPKPRAKVTALPGHQSDDDGDPDPLESEDETEHALKEMTPARRAQLEQRNQRIRHDRELAREAEERNARRDSTGQPTLAQLVAHLQKIAMAGVMPTQTVFDDTRPAGWSRATSLCTKFEISWEALATEAELKPRPEGSRRGQRVAATAT